MVTMIYFNTLTLIDLNYWSFYIFEEKILVLEWFSSFPKFWFLPGVIFSLIPFLTPTSVYMSWEVVLILRNNQHIRFNTNIALNFAFKIVVRQDTTMIDICFSNYLKTNFLMSTKCQSNSNLRKWSQSLSLSWRSGLINWLASVVPVSPSPSPRPSRHCPQGIENN